MAAGVAGPVVGAVGIDAFMRAAGHGCNLGPSLPLQSCYQTCSRGVPFFGRNAMRYLLLPLLLLPAAALAQADPPTATPPESTVAAAPATPEKTAAKDRMICRTEVETGSLIRNKKRCYTAEQWELIAMQHRNQALSIQENNAGRGSCPAGASC